MKYALITLIFLFPMLMGTACDPENPLPSSNIEDILNENDVDMKSTIKITVGEKVFTATLLDNATTTALKKMLPLTIDMTELNGNEKYFRFSNNLPTNATNPGKINSGDLMLWGANTLVLFYKSFSTSYSYTKIGSIDNPEGLAAALGSGNVTVKLDIE